MARIANLYMTHNLRSPHFFHYINPKSEALRVLMFGWKKGVDKEEHHNKVNPMM